MSDGKIIQENGENIMPITYETCVLDDEGNPITETIGDVSLLNTESRNLVGAVNEVFGDIIKEQVVDVMIDNGIETTTDENWKGIIEKIDNGLEKANKIEDARDILAGLMQEGGYDITGEEDIDILLNKLTISGIKLNEIKQIYCAGQYYSMIVKKDGSLWATGYNGYGQLGLGDTTNRNTFTQVTTNINNDVEYVVCGDNHTMIVKKDGSLWACGWNTYGQLGINSSSTSTHTTFVEVTHNMDDKNIKYLSCGYAHSVVVKNDGSVWSCGYNEYGQLGLNNNDNKYIFTQVTTNINNDVKQVACGGWHTVILKNDGTVYSCGANNYGQLGLGNTTTYKTFTKVTTNINNDVKQIDCGYFHSMIIKTDGSLWGTGDNYFGQLGLNDTTQRTTFTQVTTNINNDVECVSCGGIYMSSQSYGVTMILKTDGSVWCSGTNNSGQMGLGNSITNKSTFTQVTTNINNDVKMISCGGQHSMILKIDGTVWGTGHNSYGSLGIGTNDVKYTYSPVAKGFMY